MPLPLAPLLPIALRLGVVATAGYAVKRWMKARSFPGRSDQRAEDALDDLGEGLSLHRPKNLAGPEAAESAKVSQTNTTGRMIRVIRIGGRQYHLDAAFMARFRVSKDE
ncbi:MAG: hypothetical protein C0524_15140 [Rhodobacter sp.]|nr:hypothetical protein [Rhodobacter sp.]